MINNQRAKLDSYDRIKKFNVKYATDIATIADYAGEKTKFDAAVAIIVAGANAQQVNISGNTTASTLAKAAMANTVFKYAMRGAAKARILGNMVLAGQLEMPITYIAAATKTEAVQRAQDIRNALNSNLALLVNVTAANVTEMDAAITAYDGLKDNATVAMQAKKASGTEALPVGYTAADAAVENMYDLFYSYFITTKPAEVTEMGLAIKIINTGIRHTPVAFTVTDESGKALVNATCKDMSTEKIYTADDEGVINIDKHKAGHFHFVLSAAGKVDVDMAADIKRGTSNNFTVTLKALA